MRASSPEPLTASKIEAIRKQAYAEGLAWVFAGRVTTSTS